MDCEPWEISLQICETKSDMRARIQKFKAGGLCVGLIPTMGSLHDGHLHLVRAVLDRADVAVASIFVNPKQFEDQKDFAAYPDDLDRDLNLLAQRGVHTVFIPGSDEMYPQNADTTISVPSLANILQGHIRPGHFDGVSTIVGKLFNIIQPDIAVFGQKDYQQLALIRRMVRDLDYPVRIIDHPTIREVDGLAMSSRNVRLSPDDRAAATILNHALTRADERSKTPCTAQDIYTCVRDIIATQPRADCQAIDICDAQTLHRVQGPLTTPVVILLSVRFGDTLLIDNRVIYPRKDSL